MHQNEEKKQKATTQQHFKTFTISRAHVFKIWNHDIVEARGGLITKWLPWRQGVNGQEETLNKKTAFTRLRTKP